MVFPQLGAASAEVTPINLDDFLKRVNEINSDAVILYVFSPYASEKTKTRSKNLPPFVPDLLFNLDYQKYSVDALRKITVSFKITKEQQLQVLQHTIQQSNSQDWFKFRAGRITSSNFKSACSTSLEKPSLSLIKSICYPLAVKFNSRYTKYGIKNEKTARKVYLDAMKLKHTNFKVSDVGFCISTETPEFGASADGIIFCDCCGEGCLEIKCPFRLRKIDGKKMTLADYLRFKDSCLIKNEEGTFILNMEHAYYYQVQLHMYALEKKFCDFLLWCPDFFYGVRIPLNEEFLVDKILKALRFHQHVIKPELLARCYTDNYDIVEIELFCYCSELRDGEVIQCSNRSCEIKLFHLSCTNYLNYGNEDWLCDLCLHD